MVNWGIIIFIAIVSVLLIIGLYYLYSNSTNTTITTPPVSPTQNTQNQTRQTTSTSQTGQTQTGQTQTGQTTSTSQTGQTQTGQTQPTSTGQTSQTGQTQTSQTTQIGQTQTGQTAQTGQTQTGQTTPANQQIQQPQNTPLLLDNNYYEISPYNLGAIDSRLTSYNNLDENNINMFKTIDIETYNGSLRECVTRCNTINEGTLRDLEGIPGMVDTDKRFEFLTYKEKDGSKTFNLCRSDNEYVKYIDGVRIGVTDSNGKETGEWDNNNKFAIKANKDTVNDANGKKIPDQIKNIFTTNKLVFGDKAQLEKMGPDNTDLYPKKTKVMQMWYKCANKSADNCSGFARPSSLTDDQKGDCYMKNKIPKDTEGNLLVNSEDKSFRSFVKKLLYPDKKIKNILNNETKTFT